MKPNRYLYFCGLMVVVCGLGPVDSFAQSPACLEQTMQARADMVLLQRYYQKDPDVGKAMQRPQSTALATMGPSAVGAGGGVSGADVTRALEMVTSGITRSSTSVGIAINPYYLANSPTSYAELRNMTQTVAQQFFNGLQIEASLDVGDDDDEGNSTVGGWYAGIKTRVFGSRNVYEPYFDEEAQAVFDAIGKANPVPAELQQQLATRAIDLEHACSANGVLDAGTQTLVTRLREEVERLKPRQTLSRDRNVSVTQAIDELQKAATMAPILSLAVGYQDRDGVGHMRAYAAFDWAANLGPTTDHPLFTMKSEGVFTMRTENVAYDIGGRVGAELGLVFGQAVLFDRGISVGASVVGEWPEQEDPPTFLRFGPAVGIPVDRSVVLKLNVEWLKDFDQDITKDPTITLALAWALGDSWLPDVTLFSRKPERSNRGASEDSGGEGGTGTGDPR